MRLAIPPVLLCLAAACGNPDGGLTIHENDDEPTVTFVSPTNDELFVEGADVRFQAVLGDTETATADLSLTWSSTRGGTLSEPTTFDDDVASITIASLEAGEQTVSLQVIDSVGQSAEDSVRIVIEENLPPTIDIVSPAHGSQWSTGLPIEVAILVDDDHHPVTETSLLWAGVAAGAPDAPEAPNGLGEAGFDLSALPAAEYTLTVTTEDPYGKTLSASSTFTVVNGDIDGDGHVGIDQGGDDCDDTDATVSPSADEICNEADDNCDGQADEGLTDTPWYFDGDADGYGVTATLILDCAQPAGYSDVPGDCDDLNNTVNPGAAEVCDGIDNDCTAGADDGLPNEAWYLDGDGDGFGVTDSLSSGCAAPSADHVNEPGDCDDAVAAVNPDGTESCNGVDDDCDGQSDEGFAQTPWYADTDGDDYGVTSTQTLACVAPTGMVAAPNDCDDTDPAINPDADEICDDVDNDCDGSEDEGLASTVYFEDEDGDDFGTTTFQSLCYDPGSGWATVSGDCDDEDTGIHPDAEDVCGNGVDEDCNGTADDACYDDYTGTWNIIPTVSYSCLYGQFYPSFPSSYSYSFSSFQIVDNYPNVVVVTGQSVDGDTGSIDGTFDTADSFVATSHVENYGNDNQGFDEDYELDIVFDSWTEFTGTWTQTYESTAGSGNCQSRVWNISGTRQ